MEHPITRSGGKEKQYCGHNCRGKGNSTVATTVGNVPLSTFIGKCSHSKPSWYYSYSDSDISKILLVSFNRILAYYLG
jgi:hypothetical protein